MSWTKIDIKTDDGQIENAQAPVIVSASRSTDIPAFYADWFIERWKQGYIKWKNPFNGVPLYVTFAKTRAVVFWTKNPRPIMKHLTFLKENVKNFYFQYTLNDYDLEGYEGNVPNVQSRINTFKELSNNIGKQHVIWRFDPMILTDNLTVSELLKRVENIGNELYKYTDKLVFSFADIGIYKKVANNLIKANIHYREFTEDSMREFANGLQELNKKWNLNIGTCAEKIPLEQYGIAHNKCIDDDLLIDLFPNDTELMKFLGVSITPASLFDSEPKIEKKKSIKDKGQRELCGCIMSKDIGQYNTCPHECVYCYANTSIEIAKRNYEAHKKQPNSETILGE
jgi:DNA repair photolyase